MRRCHASYISCSGSRFPADMPNQLAISHCSSTARPSPSNRAAKRRRLHEVVCKSGGNESSQLKHAVSIFDSSLAYAQRRVTDGSTDVDVAPNLQVGYGQQTIKLVERRFYSLLCGCLYAYSSYLLLIYVRFRNKAVWQPKLCCHRDLLAVIVIGARDR
jgi:hypothetical protein